VGIDLISIDFTFQSLIFSGEHQPLTTRYRVVVLTSSHPVNGGVSMENLKLHPYRELL